MKYLITVFLIPGFYLLACSSDPKKVTSNNFVLNDIPENPALINFWKDFSVKFNRSDSAALREITLDSIWLWREKVSCNEFLKRYHSGYSPTKFPGITDTNNVRYSTIGCYPTPMVKEAIKQQYNDAYNCRQVEIINDTIGSVVQGTEFTFLETSIGYRLFGINSFSYPLHKENTLVDTTPASE